MSKIEVNTVEPQCGTTLTLGASGDTVTLGSGASQSGFGRTGTVDWDTTAITADPANAVSGTGYFANTTSAAFTITLPTSPSAGDIISVRDYAQTFATNNLTIGRNGQPIDGQTFDLVLNTNGVAVTLVYVDGTQGWKSVNSNEITNSIRYVAATGGTITTCGDDKIHTFTGPGTFTVCSIASLASHNIVSYVVVAGGGGGGRGNGGGGGAGGYREIKNPVNPFTASPLDGYPSAPNRVTVTAASFPITVGGGGNGRTGSGGRGCTGSNSVFSTITSAGGGGGGANDSPGNGHNGGSGGGGGNPNFSGGTGNTPPVTPAQGNDGGDATASSPAAGGGGGAGAVGGDTPGPTGGGNGGAGVASEINGSSVTRAGGGGGGVDTSGGTAGTGGSGGGGAGTIGPGGTASSGTANTGGGAGGGGGGGGCGGTGGSGIVIIRYKYQ